MKKVVALRLYLANLVPSALKGMGTRMDRAADNQVFFQTELHVHVSTIWWVGQ